MDLKDLRYFVAVFELRSFSRAARILGTVQSNVSTRIVALERSLGGQLFVRRWRSIAPTDRGEKLYMHAKQVMAALNDAERAFGRSRAA